MSTQIHPRGESYAPTPPSSDLAARIALLESLLAQPKLNDGRRAWAKAELKRLKGK